MIFTSNLFLFYFFLSLICEFNRQQKFKNFHEPLRDFRTRRKSMLKKGGWGRAGVSVLKKRGWGDTMIYYTECHNPSDATVPTHAKYPFWILP